MSIGNFFSIFNSVQGTSGTEVMTGCIYRRYTRDAWVKMGQFLNVLGQVCVVLPRCVGGGGQYNVVFFVLNRGAQDQRSH